LKTCILIKATATATTTTKSATRITTATKTTIISTYSPVEKAIS